MTRHPSAEFPSHPRDWFFVGVGIGLLWGLAKHPRALGCLGLMVLATALLVVVFAIIVAIKLPWLTVGAALITVLVLWSKRRARA